MAGVIDISVRTPGRTTNRKVRVLRKAGFAAWPRTPGQFKPEDHVPEHIHAVSLFDKDLSPGAKNQKRTFLVDPPGKGLANGGADDAGRAPTGQSDAGQADRPAARDPFSVPRTTRSVICKTCLA
jgi:hypothetical protein